MSMYLVYVVFLCFVIFFFFFKQKTAYEMRISDWSSDVCSSDLRGLEGFYHYREYNAVELADKLALEDVWFLLFDGHLPSEAERAAFADEIRPLRRVPESVAALLPALAESSQTVMEAVRSAMSMVGAAEGYRPTLDIDHAERRRNALQMCAVMPTRIMAIHRLQAGRSEDRRGGKGWVRPCDTRGWQ